MFAKEIDRLIAAGYVTKFQDWAHLKAHFQDVVVSRVAAIFKERDDVSVKKGTAARQTF